MPTTEQLDSFTERLPRRTRLNLAALALLGLLGVSLTLDASGDYPLLGEGPGLTVDEMFNVGEGVRLAHGSWYWLLGEFSWRQLFGEASDVPVRPLIGHHLADHPPLGRLALGLAHQAVTTVASPQPNRTTPFAPTAARFGSACAFAWVVWLVGSCSARWFGAAAGYASALALLMMPRLVTHAHLASLEMMITLAYTASVITIADRWHRDEAPTVRQALVPGVLLGLALLTKIQAVLLGPPVVLWALWRFRRRAVLPLITWGGIGLLIFVIGWPWIWIDPLGHLQEYFARTTDRAHLSVFYLSAKTADIDVPWHYPVVMFATTIPLSLHLLAAWGLGRAPVASCRDSRVSLLLCCTIFPLFLFALPGIAVYDGSRLFLVIVPLWAILVGRGLSDAITSIRSRCQRLSARGATALPLLLLLSSGWGLVATHPCGLSFYNLAIGGPAGAQRLGFEPTYWGDSLTRSFLHRVGEVVPSDETIAVFPSLHPLQWQEFQRHARAWDPESRKLALFGTAPAEDATFVMIFRRKADLPDFLRNVPSDWEVVASVRRAGVLLAALYRRPRTTLAIQATRNWNAQVEPQLAPIRSSGALYWTMTRHEITSPASRLPAREPHDRRQRREQPDPL